MLIIVLTLTEEIREIVKFGIQARKICASCTDFMFPGKSCYESFCGPDNYGYEATVSGLLVVPYGNDVYGNPPPDPLSGHTWMHGTIAETCKVPSETFGNFLSGEMVADVLASVLFAGSGQFVTAPDYLGYGESFDFHKAYIVGKPYMSSAAVLWTEASQTIADVYGYSAGCAAVVSGYSEGGGGAARATMALSCIGVDVKRAQMGAA